MTNYNTEKKYIQYNEDVLNHKVVTSTYIYQACVRMKKWFNRDDIYFDYGDVDKKIKFMQKLKHSKDFFAGKNFILEPYQTWMVANIIGWKWIESGERVISEALLLLSRKSGKTFFAAALLLAIIVTDNTLGAEGYLIANTRQQANIGFDHLSKQCKSIDPRGKIFSRYRSQIRIPILDSYVQVLSSDTNSLDGYNPSVFIVDEYHATTTTENWSILRTGQGIRRNGLGIIISSCGFLIGEEYPLYGECEKAKKVLSDKMEEDTLFAALYQLDDGDDFRDENNWIKANPTLDVTVTRKYLREQVKSANNNKSLEVSIKTKNFGVWCQSSEVWFDRDYLKSKTQHIDLHDYEGEECFMGVDFSMQDDLSAFTVLIPPNEERKLNPDKFIFKPFVYIPEAALEKSSNRSLYNYWIRNKYATLSEGNVIDTLKILDDQLQINEYMSIVDIAYDQYFSLDWQIHAEEEGLTITKHNQSLAAFTPSVDFFEYIMAHDLVVLDDNPIFLWAFGNVEMSRNETFNTKKPRKANNDVNNKIDPVIAGLEAVTAFNNSRGHHYGTVWSITE